MKKWMALLLVLLMLASLTACGGVQKEDENQNDTEVSDPAENEDKDPASTDQEETDRDPARPAKEENAETVKEAGEGTVEIKGGTNQNDAVLVPLDTKMYGTVADGRFSWFAFTTKGTEDAVYKLTAINKTLGSSNVSFVVYDEEGGKLAELQADNSGRASTKEVKELAPNTTYYITAACEYNRDETIDYVLTVKSPQAETGYQTTDSLQTAGGTTGETIYPGNNMDDAALFPLDAKVSGRVSDGRFFWFAFVTGAAENAVYKFSAVNETLDSSNVMIYIYNEEGKELAHLGADSSGRASTKEVEGLQPETVYYMAIFCEYTRKETINYTLIIKSPVEDTPVGASVEPLEKEDLVFEVPFEINSTQVMFVADQAVFVNEADAKAALAPVAEIILAHPDHPILIAGTTATSGEQASCVKLSNRRAEAVKDLLTEAFDVPASQLLTIGLGYEADPFVRGQDRDANGKFVESEGAKNRRVIVLDAEDPIAKELLAD